MATFSCIPIINFIIKFNIFLKYYVIIVLYYFVIIILKLLFYYGSILAKYQE